MGVDIEAQLAVVGRELFFRVPANGLGVGFRDQVIGLLERARVVADAGGIFAVEIVLGAVVGVGSDDIEELGDVALIDVGIRRAGEIVSNELVGALVLVHDCGLPGQEVGGQPLRIALPLQLPAGIDDAVASAAVRTNC